MTMIEIKKPMIKRQRISDDDNSTTTMAISSSSSSSHDDEENLKGYECKTCGKRFKSFQALGGHQGIHKKVAVKPPPSFDELCELRLNIIVDPTNYNNKSFSSGLHRCKQCMKEFDSGQALGGHMRRHRKIRVLAAYNSNHQEEEEEKINAVIRQRQQASDDQQPGKSDLTVVQEQPTEEVSRGLMIKAEEEDQEEDYDYERRRIMMMRSDLMLAATEWRLSII